jgi:hypothetical protein
MHGMAKAALSVQLNQSDENDARGLPNWCALAGSEK